MSEDKRERLDGVRKWLTFLVVVIGVPWMAWFQGQTESTVRTVLRTDGYQTHVEFNAYVESHENRNKEILSKLDVQISNLDRRIAVLENNNRQISELANRVAGLEAKIDLLLQDRRKP